MYEQVGIVCMTHHDPLMVELNKDWGVACVVLPKVNGFCWKISES